MVKGELYAGRNKMKKSILFLIMICLGCVSLVKPVQAQVQYAEEDENIVSVSEENTAEEE